jgi:hypothetical protein
MRFGLTTKLATLLLAISFVSGCASAVTTQGTPGLAVNLPPPPAFMGPCPPSAVKVGDVPDQAFDLEHAAFKECSQRGTQSRLWYLRLRQQYAPTTKKAGP